MRSGGELTLHISETEASFTYTPEEAEGEAPGTMALFQEKGSSWGHAGTRCLSWRRTAGCWELRCERRCLFAS